MTKQLLKSIINTDINTDFKKYHDSALNSVKVSVILYHNINNYASDLLYIII